MTQHAPEGGKLVELARRLSGELDVPEWRVIQALEHLERRGLIRARATASQSEGERR